MSLKEEKLMYEYMFCITVPKYTNIDCMKTNPLMYIK